MIPIIPDYLKDATNVYRTNHYIVKQRIVMQFDEYGQRGTKNMKTSS